MSIESERTQLRVWKVFKFAPLVMPRRSLRNIVATQTLVIATIRTTIMIQFVQQECKIIHVCSLGETESSCPNKISSSSRTLNFDSVLCGQDDISFDRW